MKQFRVTINMSFLKNDLDGFSFHRESSIEKKARKAAYDRTDKYYKDHDLIEYIKSTNYAKDMVEYMYCNSEVKSAEWDPKSFAIHMIVETEENEDGLRQDLTMNSLEDGEYETCGESGWVIFTRGPNGEINHGGMDLDLNQFWQYGVVDYRENAIEITSL